MEDTGLGTLMIVKNLYTPKVLKEISIIGLKGYDKFVFQLGRPFQPEISLRQTKWNV